MNITLLGLIIRCLLAMIAGGCGVMSFAAYQQQTYQGIMGSVIGSSTVQFIGVLSLGAWLYSLVLPYGGVKGLAWSATLYVVRRVQEALQTAAKAAIETGKELV